MYRGTTPTHIFDVPIDTSTIKTVKITYSQNDVEVLVKRTEDCVITDGRISTILSQEDTFLFDCTVVVDIQVRVLTTDEVAMTSEPIKVRVGKCLDCEVLE